MTTGVERRLFTVADESYRMPLAVFLRSVLESQPVGSLPAVHVFTPGMSAASRRRIEEGVPGMPIEWCDLRESFAAEGFRTVKTSLAPATWGRLSAADLMASRARRAVYLDIDLLVVADIGPLWEVDLKGRPVAAVTAPANPQVSCPLAGLGKLWRRLGLDPRTPYLQAGVLVMDLEAWRRRGMTGLVADACTRHGDAFIAADQDAINCVLAGDFLPLPLRWNQTSMLRGPSSWAYSFFPVEEVDEALHRPAVIHFSGSEKPWRSSPGRSPEIARWWDVAGRTAFSTVRPPWFTILRKAIRRRIARWAVE